jgi:hypothetical protein
MYGGSGGIASSILSLGTERYQYQVAKSGSFVVQAAT